MYKLMVSDLDGTLLIDHGEICPVAKETIEKAKKGDFSFTIATGRIFSSARQFAKKLDIRLPIIASNGAYIRAIDEEKPIHAWPVPKDAVQAIFDMTFDEDELMLQLYTDDTLYSERYEFSTPYYVETNKEIDENWRVNVEVVGKAKAFYNENKLDFYKVQLNSRNPEILKKYEGKFSEIPGIQMTKSWETNLEVTHAKASKGQAILALVEYLGLDVSEVIAIGDNHNDISMLTTAGKGVAMGNASDYVKSHADYVAYENTKCGVAKALEDLVMKG